MAIVTDIKIKHWMIYMLLNSSPDAYEKGFSMLKSLAPISWEQFRQIISDFAHSPTLAYENIEGKPIEVWTACEESYLRFSFLCT